MSVEPTTLSSHSPSEGSPLRPQTNPTLRLPRAKPRILAALAICLAIGTIAVPWDFELSLKLRYGSVPGDIKKLVNLSEVAAHFLSLIFIFLLLLRCDPTKRLKIYMCVGFIALAGGFANAFKMLIPRVRPNALDHLPPENYPNHWYELWGTPFTESWFEEGIRSFPSGHSATATAVAIALTYLYPKGKWFFATLAFFACYQRLLTGAHYLSDVMGGISITLVLCYLYLPVFKWGENAEETPKPADLT